jgi:hypothetical protein
MMGIKKMGIVKNFIDKLAKHKLLVYFVILWGAMLFLWTSYGMVEYGFAQYGEPIEKYIADKIYHFSELFAGLILMIFGIKLLNSNFLKSIKNEKLINYFLLLWAASFFFWGLWYMFDFAPRIFDSLENMIGFLSALVAIFVGIILGLFSWKLLNDTE